MSRTLGPIELAVSVDRGQVEPLRDQIAAQMRAAIRAGRLRPGARLPATRQLAGELGISRGVVVEAYGELVHQGFIVTADRASPRVADGVPGARTGSRRREPSFRFDLAPEVPDVALFPRRQWLRALHHALASASDQALEYGDPRGAPELREAVADYLGRARGVVADPDRIVICQGSIQAIDLACRAIAAGGATRMAIEDPCAEGIRYACTYAGLTAEAVPVRPDGLDVSTLIARDPDAVIVSPVHQFPTGAALGAPARRRLRDWAQTRARVIVEDDYDAEYAHAGTPPPALQGEAPERVVYVGSVSKALAPAIRLGWAVFPAHLADRAARVKAALDGGSPTVEQIALAHLIERAVYEHHVRHVGAEYGRRREAAMAALGARLPGAPIAGSEAGLHFTLALPAAVDRERLDRSAREHRIRLRTLEEFLQAAPALAGTLLVGYARLPCAAAVPAADALARVLEHALP